MEQLYLWSFEKNKNGHVSVPGRRHGVEQAKSRHAHAAETRGMGVGAFRRLISSLKKPFDI